MSTTLIILDYFTQQIEAGFSKEEARERSAAMLKNFREETKREEYIALCGLLERLSRI